MKFQVASVLLLPAVAGFQLAPTRVTRAVHIPRAADASYAEAIEQDRVTLRRAAATKNEESDAVVDALLGLEQSCKERSRAEQCIKSNCRGASPPLLNHGLHAIDATSARRRCGVVS